ncbi:hypothetical protein [Singulisphaera sp. PoT]|uniref:hypothetical protein n=1 Tax=Singulisphaera sp. PoT TaxID=3411797 RepID=UPI003BF587F9
MKLRGSLRAFATAGLVALLLGGSAPGVARDQAPLPPLNQKVLDFSKDHLGKKVGDGSCVTLAVKALAEAGAYQFPLSRRDGDYVWGEPVASFRDALPGDILQFRDAVFQGKKRYRGGRWETWHHSYPHHTAVVSKVSDEGKTVLILHQNIGRAETDDEAKKTVKEWTLKPDSLQKGGWVRIYRPVAANDVPNSPRPR